MEIICAIYQCECLSVLSEAEEAKLSPRSED